VTNELQKHNMGFFLIGGLILLFSCTTTTCEQINKLLVEYGAIIFILTDGNRGHVFNGNDKLLEMHNVIL
jgi:hypothetical protein